LRFPSGLACLDPSGRKSKWKSVWDENFKIDAYILSTFESSQTLAW
jgi:hypothetical protein